MANAEQAVRDAALALQSAIVTAAGDGYRVHWPSGPEGLHQIAISETGKRLQPAPVVQVPEAGKAKSEAPATFGTPRRPPVA